jgi:putative ABC transport system permease protein
MKLLREILGAKVRFLAITFVVVIGVGIFISTSLAYRNLKTSYEYTYEKLNFADFRVKAQEIPAYTVERLKELPGIAMVTPRVRADESFAMADGKRLIGRITGVQHERPIVDDLLIKEGRFFEKGDRKVCIAESHFAEFYGIHPGDTLKYIEKGTEVPLEVIGVASNPEYLVLAGEKGDFSAMLSASAMAIVWMPNEDVQSMAGLSRTYNQVLFEVDDPEEMEPVIASVEEVMKYTGIEEVVTLEEHQGNKMLESDLETFRSFALFFPVLFLGIACFSIYILLSRLVYTQRPFIGVMRAMGYTRSQILGHYLSFALIIGFLGAVLGAALGFGVSYIITGIYAGTIGIPLVKVRVNWEVMATGMSMSVLFCAVAGLVPAMSSARLDPNKAMRGEMLQHVFRRPLIERIFPPLSRTPMFLKVPVRNMLRNKRRTVFTVIGLMFSVMMVLMFLAVLNTANTALTRGFKMNNKFDILAVFLGGRDAALEDKISQLPGVREVEPTAGYDCKISWNGTTSDTVMVGIEPDSSMRAFYTPDRQPVELTERHILLNQWYSNDLGIEVGDTVTVSTEFNEKKFVVSPFIEEPMGSTVYLTRGEVRELLDYGTPSRGSFYVKVEPGRYEEALASLQEVRGLATTVDLREIRREVEQYMKLLYMIVYVMLVFALIMAFTLTFNTITINILEREKEIATMRTIGTESWKISAMTTLENVIFGLLSIIPGCILGVVVADYAMGLQSSEYFTLSLVVNPSSYFLVAAGIIVILLICQIPSLQYVKRVRLAEATKERGG